MGTSPCFIAIFKKGTTLFVRFAYMDNETRPQSGHLLKKKMLLQQKMLSFKSGFQLGSI